MRGLCLLALTAAGLLALVPFAADPLLARGRGRARLDLRRRLRRLAARACSGSWRCRCCCSARCRPYALRLAVTTVEEAGTVAGRLYALSTAGSLVGTLGSALLFIPLVGTRRTFLIFALAIAVVAVLGLRPRRRWALAPAAIAALMAVPVGTLKAEAGDGRVVYETETPYQYARVVQRPSGVRVLELNEGQAQHSLYRAAHGAHRRLLGRVPGAALHRPRPAAAPHGDPGQRRRHDRARVRAALSRDPDRRRGDRLRAVGDRAPLLRHEESAAAAPPRGRPPVPAPDGRALRRDRARHLPPALHPLLPQHRGVLRAGARPARARAGWCS